MGHPLLMSIVQSTSHSSSSAQALGGHLVERQRGSCCQTRCEGGRLGASARLPWCVSLRRVPYSPAGAGTCGRGKGRSGLVACMHWCAPSAVAVMHSLACTVQTFVPMFFLLLVVYCSLRGIGGQRCLPPATLLNQMMHLQRSSGKEV
jgi:hypothetical protein